MDKDTLAAQLTGRDHRNEISKDITAAAKASNLVIVFGESDDLMEFRGAIYDEVGACQGTREYVDAEGLLRDRDDFKDDEEHKKWCARKMAARKIDAVWSEEGGGPLWSYKTDIPHATFNIVEDRMPYCRGIVFSLDDLG